MMKSGYLKPRRDRKAIKEKKQKFIEDCEKSLIRILDESMKDGSVKTWPVLKATLEQRIILLRKQYPDYSGAVCIAARNARLALNKVENEDRRIQKQKIAESGVIEKYFRY